MKKTTFTCDRCGAIIDTDVYYITIYAEPIKTAMGEDYRQSFATACENLRQNTNEPFHLCKKCRMELKHWLAND